MRGVREWRGGNDGREFSLVDEAVFQSVCLGLETPHSSLMAAD